MVLNKGTRADDGEIDVRSGGHLTRRLRPAGEERVEGSVRADAMDAISGRRGHADASHIEAGFQKVRAATVSDRVTEFDVLLVVGTVTDVGGSEVGHSGNRHARAVAIGAGQGGATSSELAAQLVARVCAPASSSTIR